jgi:threonyl-tRNA synthetase
MTRIYGLAFESKDAIKKHLEFIEEAKRRDHKKIGKEMNLFVFSDLVGP